MYETNPEGMETGKCKKKLKMKVQRCTNCDYKCPRQPLTPSFIICP